jgi:hypothetical protein
MLAEVYGWFTEGFDTPDLKEAQALLEELSWADHTKSLRILKMMKRGARWPTRARSDRWMRRLARPGSNW